MIITNKSLAAELHSSCIYAQSHDWGLFWYTAKIFVLKKIKKKNRHQHKLFPIATPILFLSWFFFMSKSNLKCNKEKTEEIEAYHVHVVWDMAV